jgi:hypothetical protein
MLPNYKVHKKETFWKTNFCLAYHQIDYSLRKSKCQNRLQPADQVNIFKSCCLQFHLNISYTYKSRYIHICKALY